MSETVVTRFAPSPTGFLHIGGARTALFNWLFAKAKGGKMLLRIEDTDRARSTEEAIAAIMDGLDWLGLKWDDEPVFQFSRAERHRAVVEEMLSAGRAYRCYATPEELDQMRQQAQAEGRPPRYDGRWRDRDPSEAPAGRAPAIRLKAPREGETTVEDAVQGHVVFPNADLDDLVLLRSDGTPTYMLAVVVDDHDMGVTHVIRGVDHLTNAARQMQIYAALDWPVPEMAHIPLIHGPDGAKLSKRHGALGVEAYRAMGYLPQALRNYLVRLGWSAGDKEIFSTDEMISLFELDGIGKSAARFDFAKLENVNGQYMRSMDNADLLAEFRKALPYLPGGADAEARLDAGLWPVFERLLPALKERAKTLVELLESMEFLFTPRPLSFDEKASGMLTPEARALMAELGANLVALPNFSAASVEREVRAFAERKGVKLGQVAQPLRAALTGRAVSPPIFDVLEALGRDESLARLADLNA
ncbi:glutamate--tRNA ligase [Agaricicola taiwanensis]|nr:glutamate--tRNA ligase [Agaricicola taiwanensis]